MRTQLPTFIFMPNVEINEVIGQLITGQEMIIKTFFFFCPLTSEGIAFSQRCLTLRVLPSAPGHDAEPEEQLSGVKFL